MSFGNRPPPKTSVSTTFDTISPFIETGSGAVVYDGTTIYPEYELKAATDSSDANSHSVDDPITPAIDELSDAISAAILLAGKYAPSFFIGGPLSLPFAALIERQKPRPRWVLKETDDAQPTAPPVDGSFANVMNSLRPGSVKDPLTGFEPFREEDMDRPVTRGALLRYVEYLTNNISPKTEDIELALSEFAIQFSNDWPHTPLWEGMRAIYKELKRIATINIRIAAPLPNDRKEHAAQTSIPEEKPSLPATKMGGKRVLRELGTEPLQEMTLRDFYGVRGKEGRFRITLNEKSDRREFFIFLTRSSNIGAIVTAFKDLGLERLADKMAPVHVIIKRGTDGYYVEEVVFKGPNDAALIFTTYVVGNKRFLKMAATPSAHLTENLRKLIDERFTGDIARTLKGALFTNAIERGATVTELLLGPKYDNLYSIRSISMTKEGKELLGASMAPSGEYATTSVDLSGITNGGTTLITAMRKKFGQRGAIGPAVFREFEKALEIQDGDTWEINSNVFSAGGLHLRSFEAKRRGETFLTANHFEFMDRVKVLHVDERGVRTVTIYRVTTPKDEDAHIVKIGSKTFE